MKSQKKKYSNISIRESSVTCGHIWHVVILMKHTIYECLIKILHFRHKCSSIICENTQKLKDLQLHRILIHENTCIRHKFCESLVKIYVTKHKRFSFLCSLFRQLYMVYWPFFLDLLKIVETLVY